MTVDEMIKELQKFPPGHFVMVADSERGERLTKEVVLTTTPSDQIPVVLIRSNA